jgi:hypothetical protein
VRSNCTTRPEALSSEVDRSDPPVTPAGLFVSSSADLGGTNPPAVAGMHAATDDVAAAIVVVVVVVRVRIVSVVVVGSEAKPYKRASVKSVVKSSTAEPIASEASMKAAAVEASASEASMKATAVEAASAKATAVEAASAKAASVTTATTSVTAAATTATTTSECSRRLNQADGRQCEQGYNRFLHHASFLGTMSLTGLGHLRSGIIRQAKQRSR